MKSRVLKFVIPLAISAVLLLLVINSMRGEADQLKGALGSADWRLLFPAIALYFLGVLLRSVRWGMLLPEYGLKLWTLFRALVVGFTVNNLLPFRMGEVARAYLLARWGSVPYGATVASLVVERVLDGLSLSLLLLVALWLVPTAPSYLLAVGVIAGCGFFVGLALVALAAWRAEAVTMFVGFFARRMPPRLGPAVIGATNNFARSLAVVHDTGRLARLIALSLVAWCCELGLFYVLMLSVGIVGTYPSALLVGSAANFATLLPSSPGYAGTFDAALTRAVQDALNISAGLAGAYDIIVHATLFLPVVIVGTLVLWRSHITFGQVTHSPAPVGDTQYSPLTTTRA